MRFLEISGKATTLLDTHCTRISLLAFSDLIQRVRSQIDAVAPPSTMSAEPVTKDDSSDARNSTQSATSLGFPSRRIGATSRYSVITTSGCSARSKNIRVRGVSITPGQTQLARIPRAATSRDRARVNCSTAPFDAV